MMFFRLTEYALKRSDSEKLVKQFNESASSKSANAVKPKPIETP